ncbi:Beige/BEACH domain containing protein [Trichomonas vaginalis G3]|uniref:Beige/BEACH domain containing protein n=1 Tax=Trichomonas vaginalis (strain ATCC PRA-98 / G3) TaxID=412133 RepID=A2EN39_TRIV3|nr:aggrephagy protein [Trichomonas vaginalis G3]EAY05947.1 Beige/BEACH domain containing protein [Trichomonas vaginalis G3]KAI5530185.1 aggrephagy protein [Trichomonas vaginalis G3]|eukprot:XP_001318170.1 Beige/BEACH domain containing protein [Trichomonas vaginalis G3]
MVELLAENHLWSKILSLDNGNVVDIPELQVLVQSNTFPSISESEISQFSKGFSTIGSGVAAIKNLDYPFVFKPEILQQMMKYSDIEVIAPDFVISYFLNSYIAWSIGFLEGKYITEFYILLDALNFLIESKNEHIISHAKHLASSAFYHAFTHFANESPTSDFTKLISPIRDFYIANTDLTESSYDLIIKLAAILISPSDTKLNIQAAEYLSGIASMIESNPNFPGSIILSIQLLIEKSLLFLDKSSLSFHLRFSESLNTMALMESLEKFSDNIDQLFNSSTEKMEIPPPLPDIIANVPATESFTKLEWVSHLTFESEMTLPEFPSNLLTNKKCIDIIYQDFGERLLMISELVIADPVISKNFMAAWVNRICGSNRPYKYYDTLAAFVILIETTKLEIDYAPSITSLFLSPIFDDRVSIFYNSELSQQVNVIRQNVIDFYLELPNYLELLYSTLLILVPHPLCFAEFIYTLMSEKNFHKIPRSFANKILRLYYLYQNVEDLNIEQLRRVNIARASLLFAINEYLSKPGYEELISDLEFVTNFRALVYEDPVRWFALKYLFMYKDNSMVSLCINELFACFFSVSPQLPMNRMVIDILDFWFKLEQTDKKNLYCLHIHLLIKWIKEIPLSQYSNQYILKSLDIIRNSVDGKIKKQLRNEIYEIVTEKFQNYDDDLCITLFSFVASEKIGKNNLIFNFRNPKFLHTMLKIFSTGNVSLFLDILQKNLFESQIKRLECRDSKFDIELVDTLLNWIDNNSHTKEDVIMILNTIELITSGGCSSAFVYKFISTLCPKEGKFRAPYFDTIFTFFENLVNKYSFEPGAYVPVTYKTISSCFGFDNKMITDGFTVAFWLYIEDKGNMDFRILTMTDMSADKIEISVSGQIMRVEFKKSKFVIDQKFDLLHWCHCAFVFKNNMINFYFNGQKHSESVFNLENIYGGVDLIWSNPPFEADLCDNAARLGQVGFYSELSPSEISDIYNNGARVIVKSDKSYLIGLPHISKNNTLKMKFVKRENLDAKFVETPPTFNNGLIQTLKSVNGLTVLIPLLKYSRLENDDYFDRVISLIFKLINSGREYEREFENDFGFGQISAVLMSEKTLSFDLYQKFDFVSQKLLSPKLISNLNESILFNLDLWFKCSSEDLLKIVNLWFDKKMKVPLSELILSLRSYFYEQDVEKEYLKFPEIKRDENYLEARKIILKMIKKRAVRNVNNVQLQQMVGIALTSYDKQNAVEMVSVLKMIVMQVVEKANVTIFSCISNLQYLIGCGNEKLEFNIIEIFCHAHEMNMMQTIDPYMHFTVIALELKPNYGSQSLTEKILSLNDINTIPLLFVLAHNSNCLEMLFNRLDIKQKHMPHCWYFVLILVLCREKNLNVLKEGAKFLLKYIRKYQVLLNDIDTIGQIFGGHELFMNQILLILTEKGVDKELNQTIVNVFKNSFLSKPSCGLSSELQELMEETYGKETDELENDFCSFDHANQIRMKCSMSNRQGKIRKTQNLMALSFNSWLQPFVTKQTDLYFDNIIKNSYKPLKNKIFGLYVSFEGKFISREVFGRISKSLPYLNDVFSSNFQQKSKKEQQEKFFEVAQKINFEVNPNERIKEYIEKIVNASQVISKSLTPTEDPGLFSARNCIKFMDQIKRDQYECETIYKRQFNLFTVDSAPWARAVLSQDGKYRYKRDSVLCHGLIPVRMRKNYRFDNHESAKYKYESAKAQKQVKLDGGKVLKKKTAGFDSQEWECEVISLTKTQLALLSIIDDSISIQRNDLPVKVIRFQSIHSLLLKTWSQKPTAIEIIHVDGSSYFINFLNINAIDFLTEIEPAKLSSAKIVMQKDFMSFIADSNFTKNWLNHTISNFEYLLFLNFLSGRTFSSLCLYPFMPWVLKNYNCELDIKDTSIFRDFSRPIGNQEPEKDAKLDEDFNRLKSFGITPYHYNYAPIHPRIVCNWMVRMEPFTTIHITQGSNTFDEPQNIFDSIVKARKGNDFHECIPEFYFSPEFLKNENNFDFGQVNGEKISDVELPKWSTSPFDFIYKHRRLLECNYVRQHLNEWIDLIFGYKQKGEAAILARNVYLPEMYPEIWNNGNANKEQIELIHQTVGQMPQQLFVTPHPSATIKPLKVHEENWEYQLSETRIVMGHLNSVRNLVLASFVNTKKTGRTFRTKAFSHEKEDYNLADFSFNINFPEIWCYHPQGYLYCSDAVTVNLFQVKKQRVEQCFVHNSPITAMHCDTYNVVISDADSCVLVFKSSYMKEPRVTIKCYRSAIRSVFIQSSVYAVNAVMKDGNLVQINTSTKIVHSVHKVENNKVITCITPIWGLSIVCESKDILIFDVNGEYLKKVPIEKRIICLASARTPDFFDVIVAVDEDFNVWAFDAYFPEHKVLAAKIHSKPIQIAISTEEVFFTILCEDGYIRSFPLPPKAFYPDGVFDVEP